MMIKKNGGQILLPKDITWLSEIIEVTIQQQKHDGIVEQPFMYVTIRHSDSIHSITDDLWHVDGFSMRIPHIPEQNYIFVKGVGPTEFLDQKISIPSDFDPFKHNIHSFFQKSANEKNIIKGHLNTLYRIDPYCIHRRPSIANLENKTRTFVRISFVPIEIEDDTCFINPLMPKAEKFQRTDIRKKLVDYHECKRVN
jgi:hypothetical protein